MGVGPFAYRYVPRSEAEPRSVFEPYRRAVEVGLEAAGFLEDMAVQVVRPPEEAVLTQVSKVRAEGCDEARDVLSGMALSPLHYPAYTLNRERIMGARAELRRRMGAGFTMRWFHEEVLKPGAVPPSRISEFVDSE